MKYEPMFMYTVHPKRVITGLTSGTVLRAARSLKLTKNDVLNCLKKASVYRRFEGPDAPVVRVTVDCVDRLHNEKFYTEEEWEKLLEDKAYEHVYTEEEWRDLHPEEYEVKNEILTEEAEQNNNDSSTEPEVVEEVSNEKEDVVEDNARGTVLPGVDEVEEVQEAETKSVEEDLTDVQDEGTYAEETEERDESLDQEADGGVAENDVAVVEDETQAEPTNEEDQKSDAVSDSQKSEVEKQQIQFSNKKHKNRK